MMTVITVTFCPVLRHYYTQELFSPAIRPFLANCNASTEFRWCYRRRLYRYNVLRHRYAYSINILKITKHLKRKCFGVNRLNKQL